VRLEIFNSASNDKSFIQGKGTSFSALLLNYPLGLLDNVSGILYYQWNYRDLYRLVSWQRQYDNWSFYLILFWNPEKRGFKANQTVNGIFRGKGFQYMVVFHH